MCTCTLLTKLLFRNYKPNRLLLFILASSLSIANVFFTSFLSEINGQPPYSFATNAKQVVLVAFLFLNRPTFKVEFITVKEWVFVCSYVGFSSRRALFKHVHLTDMSYGSSEFWPTRVDVCSYDQNKLITCLHKQLYNQFNHNSKHLA